MDAKGELDLSVYIITLNEEARLERCLKSLPPGCEVIVVDSGSRDKTQNIAKEFGAQVFERAFDNYANQKNFALSKTTRKWTLAVDADEELCPALKEALYLGGLPPVWNEYFMVPRQLVFMGKDMRFGKTADKPIRLAPQGKVVYRGEIHEELVPLEPMKLKIFPRGVLRHYSYEDLSDYFEKFNRYTSNIAKKKLDEGEAQHSGVQVALRPWWEFFSRYFLRLGFLDGYPGYCYALVSSLYGFVKYAKYRELVASGVRPKQQ